MAEHVLETKFQLRYDTYINWMNSNDILKSGEVAIATFPQNRTIEGLSNSRPENTPPAIGMKVGDGVHYFYELPWVQAVAADVYEWAKSSYKPTYNAQEIQGLQSYVENLVGGDANVTIAPRIYQLVEGTGDNVNKYYLRYKENNENSQWILDTSTYIDLNDLVTIVDWIGSYNLENYPNMITRNAEQINYFLGRLVTNDQEVDNQFVTSVSQNNGLVSVTRARPTFSNLNGHATVPQGGTGKVTLNQDEVLVGNGTDPIYTIPIADSIGNNNYLVPNRVIKQYVDTATAGLTGAMHYIGEAGVVITPNSSVDPRIGGYVFANAEPGDVVLYEAKEFVWTGSNWRLLGDEGSYAIKGSIVDADIDPDAEISQTKIAGLENSFDQKVDKEEGKTLTSNDFTDEYKQKLDYIQDNAQRNTIEHVFLNGTEISPTIVDGNEKSIDLQVNEFDAESQAKLQSIEAEAQVNKIEKIIYDGEELTPNANRVVTITSDPHTEHINKIESIIINGVEYVPNANKEVSITIDQAALNLDVLAGARVPGTQPNTYEDVDVTSGTKQLELARVAKTGLISDLLQESGTYVTLNCGSATTVL